MCAGMLCVCVCVCVHAGRLCMCRYALHLHSYSCEDKFVQEHGVARLWEVVRFDFLLPRN